jgi:hypothetical protein
MTRGQQGGIPGIKGFSCFFGDVISFDDDDNDNEPSGNLPILVLSITKFGYDVIVIQCCKQSVVTNPGPCA